MKENENRKKTIAHIEHDSKEEGRMEGEKLGIEKGKAAEKEARIMLALKNGKLTTTEIAEMFEVIIQFVEKLTRKPKK